MDILDDTGILLGNISGTIVGSSSGGPFGGPFRGDEGASVRKVVGIVGDDVWDVLSDTADLIEVISG